MGTRSKDVLPCRCKKRHIALPHGREGNVTCPICAREYWETTVEKSELRKAIRRLTKNQKHLGTAIFVLGFLSAIGLLEKIFLPPGPWLAPATAAISGILFFTILKLKKTIFQDNLTTSPANLALKAFFSTLIVSFLFSVLELAANFFWLKSAFEENAAVAGIQVAINLSAEIASMRHYVIFKAIECSIIIIILILLALFTKRYRKLVEKNERTKNSVEWIFAFATALAMFSFYGTAYSGYLKSAEVSLSDVKSKYQNQYNNVSTKLQHHIAIKVAYELSDYVNKNKHDNKPETVNKTDTGPGSYDPKIFPIKLPANETNGKSSKQGSSESTELRDKKTHSKPNYFAMPEDLNQNKLSRAHASVSSYIASQGKLKKNGWNAIYIGAAANFFESAQDLVIDRFKERLADEGIISLGGSIGQSIHLAASGIMEEIVESGNSNIGVLVQAAVKDIAASRSFAKFSEYVKNFAETGSRHTRVENPPLPPISSSDNKLPISQQSTDPVVFSDPLVLCDEYRVYSDPPYMVFVREFKTRRSSCK